MSESTKKEEYWLAKARAGNVPSHLGIIMDGNGRWAQQQGLKRSEGHKAGVDSIQRCIPAVIQLGIKHCTVFVFSTENWKRPQTEIQFLFNLLIDYTRKHKKELIQRGVQVIPIGRLEQLPVSVGHALETLTQDTKDCRKLKLYLAINYGGRQEIFDAAVKLASKIACGGQNDYEGLTQEDFAQCLYTKGVPDPDLIIRTSGEKRISNFLLWQSAYAELVFSNVLWPDFSPIDLYKAVIDYSSRKRRFGDTKEKRSETPC